MEHCSEYCMQSGPPMFVSPNAGIAIGIGWKYRDLMKWLTRSQVLVLAGVGFELRGMWLRVFAEPG